MMKRVLTAILCMGMLLATMSIGVGATSLAIPVGATPLAQGEYASLPFTVAYGNYDGKTVSGLTELTEAEAATIASGVPDGFTVKSTTSIPCQVYTVDVSSVKTDKVTLTLKASTIEGEQFALKVLNPKTGAWDTVDFATSEFSIGGEIDKATYTQDGKIQAMATLNYVANGSNRIIWSTDQQHYTEFIDLNQTYYDIHNYMVEEYKAGNTAYVINTGDIVDDPPTYSTAAKQWIVADKAFDILDEAGVPYGIVTGNHDVGDYPINNYTKYKEYFSEDRYVGKAWYGGANDSENRSHFDLVTVGNTDLVVMYIGYGMEDDQATLEWARSVFDTYSHRSGVVCTHQYLSPIDLTRKGRGEILYNSLVVPCENVVMVMSGHYDGAGYKYVDVDENRRILEVMHDYQFVQMQDEEFYKDAPDPGHYIGTVPGCNGEGYLRDVIIEGNTVTMNTFSPVTNGDTPFGLRDNLTLNVEFLKAQREITVHRFGAFTNEGEKDTEIYTFLYKDANGREYTEYTVISTSMPGDQREPIATLSTDRTQLGALVDACKAVKKGNYTKESYDAFKTALKDAKALLKDGNEDEFGTAYNALETAKGALTEKDTAPTRDKYELVHEFNLDLSAWQNGDGTKKLTTPHSHIKAEQLEDGGFTAEKGAMAANNWPAMQYIEPITFTPKDGKVYLYLDLEAGSTWSCYPVIIQDKQQYSGRWNYIIEGSYNPTFDAGSGPYKGVFDVTEAIENMGVDVTKEMTISFSMNVVPGPVTVRGMALLTGEPRGFPWMWVAIGAGALLVIALLLFAILYKPKKTADIVETAPEEAVENAVEEEAAQEDIATEESADNNDEEETPVEDSPSETE